MLTRALAARLLERDLGGAWRVANGGGSFGDTRLATCGERGKVVRLGRPAGALRRSPRRWRCSTTSRPAPRDFVQAMARLRAA